MLRVLHVTWNLSRSSGVAAILMNLHRNIDRSKVQFDYLIDIEQPRDYEDEVKQLGGKVYYVGALKNIGYFKFKKFWHDFLLQHPEYKIVHYADLWHATLGLKWSKEHGRITIDHSHTVRDVLTPRYTPKKIIVNTVSWFRRFAADYFFACSTQAGIYKFGRKVNVRFLRNGIDTDKYSFSPKIRRAVRESRGIVSDDTLVLGHTGRFQPVKNHKFLVEVFKEVHSRVPNSKLWLVGKGILEDEVRSQVHALGLDDAVDFVGITDKVNEYLMGMDVFVFPSHFEGLSLGLVEAQTSGLPCVVSEANQVEGVVSDRVRRLRLGPPLST